MNKDKIIEFVPGQTTKSPTVAHSRDIIVKTDDSGGGNDMDNFVKKHELESVKNEILTEIKFIAKDIDKTSELSNQKMGSIESKQNWILGIIATIVGAVFIKIFFNIG